MVKTRSYIPSKLKEGYKVKDNVEEVYFITLDFDKGEPTLEEFTKVGEQFQFSWFLHTTISHQKIKIEKGVELEPKDRFRVIIPLERAITLGELEILKPIFTDKYPTIDTTCFDGNRYFMMNPDAITKLFNYKDCEFLNPDELLSKEVNKKKKTNNKKTFSITDLVKLQDKSEVQIKDIKEKTPIFCPFCIHDLKHRNNPDSHNAFLDINEEDKYFIYCSSEDKTY